MKNLAHFAHFLKSFSGLFSKPTYSTFKNTVESMVKLSDYTQADLASFSGKTLRQIQYFFSESIWCHKQLNQARLNWLRNRKLFRDRVTDDLILDGSVVKKDKDAKFSGLACFMYSNLAKEVVNGLMILGTSVRTKEGRCYLPDVKLFLKGEWKSEWEAWMSFANRVAKMAKGRLWILDRGFRNQYFLAHILSLKRLFLVRVSLSLNVLLAVKSGQVKPIKKRRYGRQKHFPNRKLASAKKWIAGHRPISCENGKLWIIPHAIVNAWRTEIKTECTVIVFHRNGFRHPLLLVYSNSEVNTEKALELVGRYIGRWSIETLFKEAKSWFCLSDFRITSLTGIYRFLHMAIFTHSLLTVLLKTLQTSSLISKLIAFVLQRSRNIYECMIIGLKLFYESVLSICLTPPKWLNLKQKRTLIRYFL